MKARKLEAPTGHQHVVTSRPEKGGSRVRALTDQDGPKLRRLSLAEKAAGSPRTRHTPAEVSR
jgi:hypothetical protein